MMRRQSVFEEVAGREGDGDRPCVLAADGTQSYGRVRQTSERLTRLLKDGGLRPGDRVGY